jgi:hypothetical protein
MDPDPDEVLRVYGSDDAVGHPLGDRPQILAQKTQVSPISSDKPSRNQAGTVMA